MKRTLLYIFLSLVLIGCSSKYISFGPYGSEEASNYTITQNETFDANGKLVNRVTSKVPFVPDRWYSDALDKLAPLMQQIMAMWKIIGPVSIPVAAPTATPAVTPATTPTTTPVPTLTPYPAPVGK